MSFAVLKVALESHLELEDKKRMFFRSNFLRLTRK